MRKPKTTPKKYAADIAAARRAGGEEQQTHWQGRLEVVMKRRARTVKKAPKD